MFEFDNGTIDLTYEGDVVDLILEDHEFFATQFEVVARAHGEDKEQAFEDLRRALVIHEVAEEELIWPMVSSISDEGRQIADARKLEEDKAEETLKELEEIGCDDPRFDPRLEQLRKLVTFHAAAEERNAFPFLRSQGDRDRLKSMRKTWETAKKYAPTHPHPNVPQDASARMAAGPFAAIVDRVRDAIAHAEAK